jgi:hypothetical protein
MMGAPFSSRVLSHKLGLSFTDMCIIMMVVFTNRFWNGQIRHTHDIPSHFPEENGENPLKNPFFSRFFPKWWSSATIICYMFMTIQLMIVLSQAASFRFALLAFSHYVRREGQGRGA